MPGNHRESIDRWAGPLVIVIASMIMLGWSWGKWPDVLIDFGRELYIPWRLAEGEILFSNIAYFNGPLSPYINALWFRLFGTSLQTLVVCNLVILAVLIAGLYRILCEISDRAAATVACLSFIIVFAFGQLDDIGNYNYICPYSHELTHGLTLSIGAILCLSNYLRRRKLVFLSGAGFALGLVFLTKAEVFVAAALASTVGLGCALWLERPIRRRLFAIVGAFAGAAACPPVTAFILLSRAMPAEQALRGTLGSWPFVLNRQLVSLEFYRWGMGTLDPQESLTRILFWLAVYAAIFLPAAGIGLYLTRPGRHRMSAAVAIFELIVALLGFNWQRADLLEALAPLPLFMVVMGAATGLALFRIRQPRDAHRLVPRMSLSVFALVLLGKIFFNARFDHYGFALAMPAMMLAIVAAASLVPNSITRRGGYGGIFRAAGLAVWLVVILVLIFQEEYQFSNKQYIISNGADKFIADTRGIAVNVALKEIDARMGRNQSLAVLPEGVMLNYLSRKVNSTPYINFMPPELIIFGEERILDSFRASPPDYIALVDRNTTEYGFPFFGQDYGERLFSWIQDNYDPVRLVGSPPLQGRGFGISLLRRATNPQKR